MSMGLFALGFSNGWQWDRERDDGPNPFGLIIALLITLCKNNTNSHHIRGRQREEETWCERAHFGRRRRRHARGSGGCSERSYRVIRRRCVCRGFELGASSLFDHLLAPRPY
ncbi:hypothetical protein NL676_006515 [Syzygium grande]|nr:hypothetical protein NL676_006515 [Syzygium grande]